MKHLLNDYICIIKSHCEAPDFEYEGQAENKFEFAKSLMNWQMADAGWTPEMLVEYIASEDEINEEKSKEEGSYYNP